MNPTLQEPDLLEVRPYGTRRIRPGDVVCFKSSETGTMVVHRVVSVGRRSPVTGLPSEAIRTRGDNNLADDPILQANDVVGRVTASQRGAQRRVIAGGWIGLVVLRCTRLGRGIRRRVAILPRALHRLLADIGPFDRLLPRGLRPRLARFDARYRVFAKLLMGRRTVGQYDDLRGVWRVRRPFHLFVDEKSLPNLRPKSETRNQKSEI